MDMSILNVPLQWQPDRTFLVPGHGFVYDKFELLEYRDAVTVVRDRVQDLIAQGKTLAQVKADPHFSSFKLVTQSRLSVMAVAPDLDKRLRTLCGL